MPFILLAGVLVGISALLVVLALTTGRGLTVGTARLLEGAAAAQGPVGIPPQERIAALRQQAVAALDRFGRGKKVSRSLEQRLKWAGVSLSPAAWQMLPYPLAALGVVAGIAIGEAAAPSYLPVVALVGALVGGMAPSFALSSRLSRRRVRIASEILTYTEYLAMAMQAGADFRTAVAQVEDRFPGPVAEAFSTAVFTSSIGGELDDGLREAQATLNNRDADAIITVLIKQRIYGAQGTAQLLESVAAVRRERVEKVLEKASRAAMMLLLPIAIFIIPVFFGLILYPMLSQAMSVLK